MEQGNFQPTNIIMLTSKIFEPLIKVLGPEFQNEIKNSIHNIIFKITQADGFELDNETKGEIFHLNLLYEMFNSNDLITMVEKK